MKKFFSDFKLIPNRFVATTAELISARGWMQTHTISILEILVYVICCALTSQNFFTKIVLLNQNNHLTDNISMEGSNLSYVILATNHIYEFNNSNVLYFR